MTTYYLDLVNGNDSADGLTFANRWKTITTSTGKMTAGDTLRVMKTPDPTSIGNATWTNQSSTVTLAGAVTANIDNGEAAWTASTNVTSTANSSTYRENTKSASNVSNGSFTTGKMAYKTMSSTDFSGYKQVSFWIQVSTAVTASQLSILLCSDTIGAVAVNTINIPAINVTGRWVPITVDTGGALGSAIQSVSLFANSTTASNTILLDNIIACKDSTSADSLTLTSLIGKNTTGETWYGVMSINGTTVKLEQAVTTLPGATGHRGYYGTTETVTTYKREAFRTAMVAAATTAVNSTSIGVNMQGGWDTTNMSTQNGMTWMDGGCGYGAGFSNTGANSVTINQFGMVRYSYGFYNVSGASTTYLNNFAANNNTVMGVNNATASTGLYSSSYLWTCNNGGDGINAACSTGGFGNIISNSNTPNNASTCGAIYLPSISSITVTGNITACNNYASSNVATTHMISIPSNTLVFNGNITASYNTIQGTGTTHSMINLGGGITMAGNITASNNTTNYTTTGTTFSLVTLVSYTASSLTAGTVTMSNNTLAFTGTSTVNGLNFNSLPGVAMGAVSFTNNTITGTASANSQTATITALSGVFSVNGVIWPSIASYTFTGNTFNVNSTSFTNMSSSIYGFLATASSSGPFNLYAGTASNNTVNVNSNTTGASTSFFIYSFYNLIGSHANLVANSNTINYIGSGGTASASMYYIHSSVGLTTSSYGFVLAGTNTFSSNTIDLSTVGTGLSLSGTLVGMTNFLNNNSSPYGQGGTISVSNVTMNGNTVTSIRSGSTNTIAGTLTSASPNSMWNNIAITNNTATGPTAATSIFRGLDLTSAVPNSNSVFSNITITGNTNSLITANEAPLRIGPTTPNSVASNHNCTLSNITINNGRWAQMALYQFMTPTIDTISITAPALGSTVGLWLSATDSGVFKNFTSVGPFQYSMYFINGSSHNVFYGGSTTGATGSALYHYDFGINYFNAITINEATKAAFNMPYSNARMCLHNLNGTTNNHWNYLEGGYITVETGAGRHTLSGIAWSLYPTSTTRTSNYPLTLSLAKIAVVANVLVTVQVWIYKSTNDTVSGISMLGGQIAGVSSNLNVSSTLTATWEQVTMTFTPTEAGVVEVSGYAYGDVNGYATFDDMTITQ